MKHYRCHKAHLPKTRAEIISGAVEPPPPMFSMPQMSSVDATYYAAHNIIYALQNTEPANPLVKLGNGHK